MHTHYYVHRSHGTRTSNKLQKEISDYLVSLDGKLIDSVDIGEFKKIVVETIRALNLKHKRCKPYAVYFEENSSNRSIILAGFYHEYFYLYKATLSHLSTVTYQSLSNN